MITRLVWTALLLTLFVLPVGAQAPLPVTPTDRLAFDYAPADLPNVTHFRLCVNLPAWPSEGADLAVLAGCQDLGIPATSGQENGLNVYPIAFPALTPGQHRLAVYAVNPAGFARSNLLDVQVFVARPNSPRNLRIVPVVGGE